MKHIKRFIFNSAKYNVSGIQNDTILEIDYLNNRYKLKSKENIMSKDLEHTVRKVA